MKRMIRNLGFAVVLVASIPSTKANYFGDGIFKIGSTTDGIDFNEINLKGESNKRDIIWPYLNENENKSSFGLNYYHRFQKGPQFKYNLHQLTGKFDYQFHIKHKLKTVFGFYNIKEDNFDSESGKLTGSAQLISAFTKHFNTQFTIGRKIGAEEIFLQQGSLRELLATFLEGRLQYEFLNDWLVTNLIARKHYLEGDNERDYYDGELMLSLMKYPHWIRMGWGYHELKYSKNSVYYWSPQDFYAHGPRLDLSFTVMDPLQFYLGGSYNWFEENKTFQGSGYYMRTGLRYGVREDYLIDLSYERNESIQNSNSWVSQSFALNYNRFF